MSFGNPTKIAPVEVQGRALRCNVCDNGTFWEQEIQLSTSLFAFLETNRAAQCAVCARCGFVHMFIPPATVPIEDAQATPSPQGA